METLLLKHQQAVYSASSMGCLVCLYVLHGSVSLESSLVAEQSTLASI